ncbi:MAG: T9SS type A sorting domain-containing protein [Candidatus Kapabacteria bacterium]|nr:T9SS type A sorting domain-containing protein [Candidatus Kapabacteria bacterium]
MKRNLYSVLIAIIISAICSLNLASALDVDINKLKQEMPFMFGSSNVSNDFWFTVPPCFDDASGGAENFIRIFITSPFETQCVVEIPAKGFYSTQKTIPNDVIQFPLTPAQAQVYVKKGGDPYVAEKIYKGAGIHVYADAPLTVYVSVRYHYTSDSWLCIPTSALGTDYIVSSYGDMTAMFPSYNLPSLSGCVGVFDDTKVTFTLAGNPQSVTAGGLKPFESTTVTLNKGDVWMLSSKGPNADLTGSIFSADKPVAVVSGNQCANIPTDNQWCDYIAEMDMPTYIWGLDYFVGQLPGRKYPSILRIYAKYPGTSIYRDSAMVGTISEVPGLLGKGWLEQRMHPMGLKPHSVCISGSAPINVVQYNTGVQEDGYPLPNSDPFEMSIAPLQQYQKEVTFCTPGLRGNFGFTDNFINLVYETDGNGLMPYDMMFAKVESGQFTWKQLNQKFPGKDEKFTKLIQPGDRAYALKLIRLPEDGVYKIKAEKPFAAYAFGYGYCDSYGHVVSANFADLSVVDEIPPDPHWTVSSDGNITDGTVTDIGGSIANRGAIKDGIQADPPSSNLARINLIPGYSYNYELKYQEFIPGKSKTTNWTLKVVDPIKAAKAYIRFSDRRGNDTVISARNNKVGVEDNLDIIKSNDNGIFLEVTPNPVENNSTINFSIKQSDKISIRLYDQSGKLVETLAETFYESGLKSISFKSGNYSHGVYFIQLKTSSNEKAVPITIIK